MCSIFICHTSNSWGRTNFKGLDKEPLDRGRVWSWSSLVPPFGTVVGTGWGHLQALTPWTSWLLQSSLGSRLQTQRMWPLRDVQGYTQFYLFSTSIYWIMTIPWHWHMALEAHSRGEKLSHQRRTVWSPVYFCNWRLSICEHHTPQSISEHFHCHIKAFALW